MPQYYNFANKSFFAEVPIPTGDGIVTVLIPTTAALSSKSTNDL